MSLLYYLSLTFSGFRARISSRKAPCNLSITPPCIKMIRRHTYSRSLATLSMAFTLIYPASGVISYTVGGFTETFDGVPPASDWRTSFTVFDAGGITNQTLVYNTIADLDAAMTGVTAASEIRPRTLRVSKFLLVTTRPTRICK